MPKLSVLFASLRPDYANVALMNLLMSLRGGRTEFEIVAVAPFPLEAPEIKYVPEEKSLGCYPAYRKAFEASTGDVIAFFTDDMIATPGWAREICEEVKERERLFFPYVGSLRPINAQLFATVYDLFFANWPVFSRASAAAFGAPYGSEFPHHFGDCDLALRVWTMGGRVEVMPRRPVFVLMENARRQSPFASRDELMGSFRHFHAKWGARLGVAPDVGPESVMQVLDREVLHDNTFIGQRYPASHPFRHPSPRG